MTEVTISTHLTDLNYKTEYQNSVTLLLMDFFVNQRVKRLETRRIGNFTYDVHVFIEVNI